MTNQPQKNPMSNFSARDKSQKQKLRNTQTPHLLWLNKAGPAKLSPSLANINLNRNIIQTSCSLQEILIAVL